MGGKGGKGALGGLLSGVEWGRGRPGGLSCGAERDEGGSGCKTPDRTCVGAGWQGGGWERGRARKRAVRRWRGHKRRRGRGRCAPGCPRLGRGPARRRFEASSPVECLQQDLIAVARPGAGAGLLRGPGRAVQRAGQQRGSARGKGVGGVWAGSPGHDPGSRAACGLRSTASAAPTLQPRHPAATNPTTPIPRAPPPSRPPPTPTPGTPPNLRWRRRRRPQ